MSAPGLNGLSQLANGDNKFLRMNLGQLVVVCVVIVSIWLDPRITYLQREITAIHEQTSQIDNQGTRRSQYDLAKVEDKVAELTRRSDAFEAKLGHIDDTLTAILQKLSERK
jgi:hypothetical protein